ncbi:MAG: NADH-quinone oxidoreductase subunit L [Pirellulaceae bacterium]|nr:MAG: NADH-quinone oxidoreductase subunit L [Pirellulaceae bacterium]
MEALPALLGIATLLPLASFFVIFATARFYKKQVAGGWIALSAILGAALLSFVSLAIWCVHHFPQPVEHHAPGAHHADRYTDTHSSVAEVQVPSSSFQFVSATRQAGEHAAPEPQSHRAEHEAQTPHAGDSSGAGNPPPPYLAGEYWTLGRFGSLEITIGYYIDLLTVLMFCMVTFIASCIHIYSFGYMHEEEHEVTDHEVTLADGHHLHRPGRFARFFQYMSLFCFSMLGLVLAGNIAMVFVFWELVGICSYFLIGFYVERKSASNAANKAFIVNRVGDFGFIIGLMALWSSLGTFAFGDVKDEQGNVRPGIFSLLRSADHDYRLQPAEGMVRWSARQQVAELVESMPGASRQEVEQAISGQVESWRGLRGPWNLPYGYWLLIIAGLGVFCGCVGKSAQFPLHVWLPDAMEGPTPVSALVHSATMVAAGVYLVGRFYPVFTPEVLWVIALVGCITLFMAATIALTATDIKRVLAYSTVSQLGYMMLALGVGGWLAGMMHLVTHAFFKSLLFLCSGSVIHAVHTNDMRLMGGLRKKMPITALTMLVGCLAIAGAGVPFVVGLSGYYSKDKILEQAFSYLQANAGGWGAVFFGFAAGGAALTSFYMFRLWYMTFAGSPRDEHRYEHAHESPANMWVPLVVLAVLAVAVAWQPADGITFAGLAAIVWLAALAYWLVERPDGWAGWLRGSGLAITATFVGCWLWSFVPLTLENMLEQARPVGTLPSVVSLVGQLTWPSEPESHAYVVPITVVAFATAVGGFLLATIMYGLGYLNPEDVRRQFPRVYRFLWNKWWFDELYDYLFVQPAHLLARCVAALDKRWIDGLIDTTARLTAAFSNWWDRLADRMVVDGSVNLAAAWTYDIGLSLRRLQTGRLRQYVMFIVIGTLAIFVLISLLWNPTLAR